MDRIRIAIDGPAGSGKGTAARLVARALGYTYVDTGAMYRVVGLLATEQGVSLADGPSLGFIASAMALGFEWAGDRLSVHVDGRDVSEAIRTEAAGKAASDVSVHPEVRAALLGKQQSLAEGGGVVMEGRDIGTVVVPDAELKVYLDATPEERARRRHAELALRGIATELENVLKQVIERDAQDAGRAAAPLQKAPDALALDSTGMTPEQVAERIVAWAHERGAKSEVGSRSNSMNVEARFWIRSVVEAGLPLKVVLREISEEVMKLVKAESASVVLLDREKNELVFYAIGGKEGHRSLDEYRFPASHGITGHVVSNGESALVNDPANDSRFYSAVSKDAGLATHNIMVAALRHHGEIIGAIDILNKEGGFDQADLELLEEFAYWAGNEIGLSQHLTEQLRKDSPVAVAQPET